MDQVNIQQLLISAAALVAVLMKLAKFAVFRRLARACLKEVKYLSTPPRKLSRNTRRILNFVGGYLDMSVNYGFMLPFFAYATFAFFWSWFSFDHHVWWRQILCMAMTFLFAIFAFWAKFAGDRARYDLKAMKGH